MYDTILEIWRSERRKTTLNRLQPEFFAMVREHLSHLHKVVSDAKTDLEADFAGVHLQRVRYVLDDFIAIRRQKIIDSIIAGLELPLMALEEQEFADSQRQAVKRFHSDIYGGPASHASHSAHQISADGSTTDDNDTDSSDEDTEYLVVRITKPIEAFIGADVKQYGPLAAEDVLSLPSLNAKNLIRMGNAELVSLPKA